MSRNIQFKRRSILEMYIPKNEVNQESWNFWITNISKLVFEKKQSSHLYILTLGQNKSNSIGFDIGEVWKEDKFNSVKYLVTDLSKASFADIVLLVDTDEFYLGSIILLLKQPTDDDIKKLIVLWNNDLAKSDMEFLKMDSDGNCFYWYNPELVDEAEKLLRNTFT